jgi:hypothetical protein
MGIAIHGFITAEIFSMVKVGGVRYQWITKLSNGVFVRERVDLPVERMNWSVPGFFFI